MGGLPRWYPVAAVALAASVGAALGAGWTAVRPAGAPGLAGLGALFAAAAAAGTAAAARPRGILPRRRVLLVARAAARIAPEVVIGIAAAFALTGRVWAGLLVFVLLRAVRRQAFTLARRVMTVRTAGRPTTVTRARATIGRWLPIAMAAAALAIAASGLDHSGGLWGWRSAPLVLTAAGAALVVLAGVEQEALAARFRRAGATLAPDLGQRWWGAAGGCILLLLIVAALLPPPPGALALGHVRQSLVNWLGRLLLLGATPAAAPPPAPPVTPPVPVAPEGWRQRIALLLTVALMLGLGIWVALDLWRGTGRVRMRLGDSLRDLLSGLGSALRDALALIVGFAAALGTEVRGGGWLGAWRVLWQALAAVGVGLAALWNWRRRRRGATRAAGDAVPMTRSVGTLPPRWKWDLPPGDPRRRVREFYRAFVAEAARVGMGRAPAQTPSAHRRAVEAADPEAAAPLGELTDAYQWARFSPHPVSGDQMEAAERGWRRLSSRLAARVRRGRGA